MGQDIQDKFSSYSCGEDTCASACVSAWEFKEDVFSTEAQEGLLSSIFAFKLWDPIKFQELTADPVASGVMVDIVGKPNNDTYLVSRNLSAC